MNELQFILTSSFAKWVRKNRLEKSLEGLLGQLTLNPRAGVVIPGGNGLRKIRMAGGNRGKRGGFRVIYFIVVADERIALLEGYAKNETDDLSPAELAKLVALATELRGN